MAEAPVYVQNTKRDAYLLPSDVFLLRIQPSACCNPNVHEIMKTSSLFALSSIALCSGLMADEALIPEPIAKPPVEARIAICGVAPNHSGSVKQLKDMEASDESIQSILRNEETKTTIEKLNAPIILNSMEEALKHLTRDSMERIAEVVDFEKQQVVVFAWQGSGQDRLNGHLVSPKDGANFQYTPGRTKDLKTHSTIYAMPKGTKMNVMKLEHRIIRCGVGELEGRPMKLQIEPGIQKLELKLEQKK